MMDRDEILRKAGQIALSVLRTNAEEVDRDNKWPEQSIRALQAQGLAGLVIPLSAGGLNQGLLTLVQVCEILGKECASSAMCFGMHCVGSAVLSAKATEDQTRRFLIPIAKGEHLTTLALSEPGTGSHFYIPQTTLKVAEGLLEINGAKSFVTNGSHADSYVISTVAEDPHAPLGEFSMIILSKDSQGINWQKPWSGLGMRGNSSRDVQLENVKIPEANLLGEKGDEIWYVFEIVAPYFLMAMAGTYLGVAEAAIEEAIAHLSERAHSHAGVRLSSVGILQHRLGTLWSRLESARQLVYNAAAMADQRKPDALPSVLSAKAEVADVAVYVVNEVLTLLGGKGFAKEGKVSRLLRDVRAAQVMAPTTDMLRTWTGRALLGLPLLSGD